MTFPKTVADNAHGSEKLTDYFPPNTTLKEPQGPDFRGQLKQNYSLYCKMGVAGSEWPD